MAKSVDSFWKQHKLYLVLNLVKMIQCKKKKFAFNNIVKKFIKFGIQYLIWIIQTKRKEKRREVRERNISLLLYLICIH